MFRVNRADLKAAEAAMHAADEVADCAGLLVADALLSGSPEVEALLRNYRAARAEATWRAAVYSDALAQRTAVPA